jgi:cytochrome P450
MTAVVPPLFGSDMLTDPYAKYARVRGPVTWNQQIGLWLVTRYDDVRWALGEPKLSSNHALACRRLHGRVIGLAC